MTRARTAALIVLSLGAVLLAGLVGFVLGQGEPSPFEAEVVAVSSDGDSLCIDRDEDDCAQPVINPEDRDRLEPGVTVLVTELLVEQGDAERLIFVVDVPD